MPQLTGMTPLMSIVASRKSAALRVGVVTARVMSKVRLASAHANFTSTLLSACGSVVKSTTFSAITWFVAMIGMPRLRASRVRPRPMMMWDWMCTTSGLTESSTRRAWCFDIQGKTKVSQSCGYQRHDGSRCIVMGSPSMTSVKTPCRRCVALGAMTCTEWPRATSPAARRSAKRAAPFTCGAKVSAPMTIVRGERPASSLRESSVVAGGVTGVGLPISAEVTRGRVGVGGDVTRSASAAITRVERAGASQLYPSPPAATRIRLRNAETAGRCRRDTLGARDGIARVQGRRHRKAAIGMLLAQVTGAAGASGSVLTTGTVGSPAKPATGFAAWAMSQAVPFLMRRANGRVLVWVWKADPELLVVMAQVQEATPQLRAARASMPMEYDDTETFRGTYLGNGEKLVMPLPGRWPRRLPSRPTRGTPARTS